MRLVVRSPRGAVREFVWLSTVFVLCFIVLTPIRRLIECGEVDEAIFNRSKNTTMMTYKGYHGNVTFDDEAETFHGEVTDLRDVVTFQGRSVDELKTAFHQSIDDYLDFCADRGEEPDRPYSGNFVLRIDPQLHRKLAALSQEDGSSLNRWVESQLATLTRQRG